MVDRLAQSIGRTARAARIRLNLTQAEVAELLETAPEVYGRLERGKMLPSVRTLRRLCEILGISADECLELRERRVLAVGERAADYSVDPGALRIARRLERLSPRQLRLVVQLGRELGTPRVSRRRK